MAGKKGKSGNRAGHRKIGVRDRRGKGGEKGLGEVVERRESMSGEGRALASRGDGTYDVLENMVKNGDFGPIGGSGLGVGPRDWRRVVGRCRRMRKW